jgi:hypothetical protein
MRGRFCGRWLVRDRQVDGDEAKTACEAGDGVAKAFRWGATNEEVLFVFRDEVDVLFDVALGHVGSSFFRGM